MFLSLVKIFTSCSLLLLLVAQRAQGQASKKYVGDYELQFYRRKKTFNEAKEFCENKKSILVKTDNGAITDAVTSVMSKSNGWTFWIGATDRESEGTWKWLDGTTIKSGDIKWSGKNPDNHNGVEHCAQIFHSGKINDNICERKIGFVCQKNTPSEIRLKYKNHIYICHQTHENFFTAKEKCIREGMRLAKIDDMEKHTLLSDRSPIQITNYWIGGSGLLNQNTWRWNNQSLINMNEGWRANKPDHTGERCLMFGESGFDDHHCYNKHPFICEAIQPSIIILDQDSALIRTCKASGLPQPEIYWYKGPSIVPMDKVSAIYQETTTSVATLFVQNATLLNEGNYSCAATNVINNSSNTASLQIFVRASSYPTIKSATPISCNSSLLIDWSPHDRAQGLKHRISVWNQLRNDTIYVVPENVDNMLEFKYLTSSTSYNITIVPCPKECTHHYEITHRVYFPDFTNFTNVTVAKANESLCIITWQWPEAVSYNFTIDVMVTSVSKIFILAEGMDNTTRESNTWHFENYSKIFFPVKPNKIYKFGVQEMLCKTERTKAKNFWAKGQCVTDIQAPEYIYTPKILVSNNNGDDANSIKFILRPPDQTNGPISCLFLIVSVAKSPNFTKKITNLSGLVSANHTTNDSLKEQYITIAIAVPSIAQNPTSMVIGDGGFSSCDIASVSKRSKRSIGNIFVAKNAKLEENQKYRMYLVSTTPSDGDLLLQTSNETEIYIDAPDQQHSIYLF